MRGIDERFGTLAATSKGRQRLPPFFLSALIVLLLLPPLAGASGSVTISNVSDYPWLKAGAFATYQYATVGGPPAHVLPNGMVLLDIQPVSPPGVSLPPPNGTANLTWKVFDRSGDMASLNVTFESSGCEYSQQEFEHHLPCTRFEFGQSVLLTVNVTSGESYTGGQPQGRLNFWAPPLLVGGKLYLGSEFVGGMRIDSIGDVGRPSMVNFGGPGVNSSGTLVPPPYYNYQVNPATFGVGGTYKYAWLNASGVNLNNPNQIQELGPSGSYDYYNGLGVYISGPEYPILQTVCNVSNSSLSDCRYAAFGTTLGKFFYTGEASFILDSTNISLSPTQGQTQSGANVGWVYYAVSTVVAAGVVAIVVMRARMKSRK